MAFQVRPVDYFNLSVSDEPDHAYELLTQLAELGINLLAFSAVPAGPAETRLTVFPADGARLQQVASQAAISLDGPHPAILVQGDDELGVLATVHAKLAQADVNVYASSGVADGKGSFGYVIYVRPEEHAKAAQALEL